MAKTPRVSVGSLARGVLRLVEEGEGMAARLRTLLPVSVALAVAAATLARAVPRSLRAERSELDEGVARSLLEIDLSELAEQRAELPEVRAIARSSVQADEKLNHELTRQAFRRGAHPRFEVAREDRPTLQLLARQKGAELDLAYLNLLARLEQRDLRTLDRLQRLSRDPKLRHWAATTRVEIQRRLQRVRILAGLVLRRASAR